MSSISAVARKANQENKENYESILSKIVKKRPEGDANGLDETVELQNKLNSLQTTNK